MASDTKASTAVPGVERLLDKWAVEECTSLDITTIYRQMMSGRFPRPVRVGVRRVAWRASDIVAWQGGLVVGTAEPPNPNHRRRRMGRR
jgi:prophage regulatory protein